MADVTYYVALPFTLGENGDLVPGEPLERQTPTDALLEAQRLAQEAPGAVAFCRIRDPSTGEFQDAVIIKAFGDVPSLDDLLSAG